MGEFTKEELEVAKILEQLAELMLDRERRDGLVRWGARRRRSVQEACGGQSYTSPRPPRLPPLPTETIVSDVGGKTAAENSPTTPFSFSPSDVDDDVMTSNCSPAKTSLPPFMSGNRYEQSVVEEKLKIFNQQLRELKSQMETMELQESKHTSPQQPPVSPHHRVTAAAAISPAYTAESAVVRQPVLPDLNVVFEEVEEQEIAKSAMFAETRKRRKELQRGKNSNNNLQLHKSSQNQLR